TRFATRVPYDGEKQCWQLGFLDPVKRPVVLEGSGGRMIFGGFFDDSRYFLWWENCIPGAQPLDEYLARIWPADTGSLVSKLANSVGPFNGLPVLHRRSSGKWLADVWFTKGHLICSDINGIPRVWDIHSGKLLATNDRHRPAPGAK